MLLNITCTTLVYLQLIRLEQRKTNHIREGGTILLEGGTILLNHLKSDVQAPQQAFAPVANNNLHHVFNRSDPTK